MKKGLIAFAILAIYGCGSGGSGSQESADDRELVMDKYIGEWISGCMHIADTPYFSNEVSNADLILEEINRNDILVEPSGVWLKEELEITEVEMKRKWSFYSDVSCNDTHELQPIFNLLYNDGEWADKIVATRDFTTDEGFTVREFRIENNVIKFANFSEQDVHLTYYVENTNLYIVRNSENKILESLSNDQYSVDFNTFYIGQ